MVLENILEELDILSNKNSFDDDDLKTLTILSDCDDSEVRADIAELLLINNSQVSKNILMKLSFDTNYLVRINACDSLYIFDDIEVIKLLKKISKKDKNSIVRTYALFSLCDIVLRNKKIYKNDYVNFFSSVLSHSKIISIKLSCYRALYLFGKKQYIKNIVKELHNKRYTTRCFAINMLLDIVDDKNKNKILSILISLKKKEKLISVISTINRALLEIKSSSL